MYSMRAVTLVVSFMFSHALAECAYGNETTCNDEADSSTLLQTMTYASESDDRCEGWCEEVPTDWAEKCAWPHCKGCASCGKCKEWCEQIPTEWSTKCAWKDCKACSSCSGTPPSPPPPAPPSPSSPYPGYAKKDGGYYGEPAGGYCEGSLDSVGRAWCILPRAKAREKCNELADCIGVSENTDAAWLGAMSAAKPEDAAQLGKGAFVSDSTWTTWKKGETAPPPSPPPPPPPSPPPANGAASGETGSEGTPGSVPDTIPDRFLNCHNYWRCIHGSPPIKWDKDVAQGSQEWANRGQMRHSDCYHIPPPQGPTGENLASGSSMSPEQACQMWHDESPEKGPSCGGHCTAMLWKSAYKLGCGVKGGLVVCRYGGKSLRDGTPNFGGRSEYRQNVGYPDNSKEAECKKQWPLSTKGSTNGGGGGRNPFGGGGGGSGNPFGSGGGGGNPFGGSGGGGGDPFGGSGGGSSPFGGSGGSR